eukprot:363637-Chlamydomonas_euryale.AAC.6
MPVWQQRHASRVMRHAEQPKVASANEHPAGGLLPARDDAVHERHPCVPRAHERQRQRHTQHQLLHAERRCVVGNCSRQDAERQPVRKARAELLVSPLRRQG